MAVGDGLHAPCCLTGQSGPQAGHAQLLVDARQTAVDCVDIVQERSFRCCNAYFPVMLSLSVKKGHHIRSILGQVFSVVVFVALGLFLQWRFFQHCQDFLTPLTVRTNLSG